METSVSTMNGADESLRPGFARDSNICRKYTRSLCQLCALISIVEAAMTKPEIFHYFILVCGIVRSNRSSGLGCQTATTPNAEVYCPGAYTRSGMAIVNRDAAIMIRETPTAYLRAKRCASPTSTPSSPHAR